MAVTIADVSPQFRLTGRVTLRPLPADGTPAAAVAAVTATTGFWGVPWTLLAVVVALAASAVALRVWRRRPSPAPANGRHRPRPALS